MVKFYGIYSTRKRALNRIKSKYPKVKTKKEETSTVAFLKKKGKDKVVAQIVRVCLNVDKEISI